MTTLRNKTSRLAMVDPDNLPLRTHVSNYRFCCHQIIQFLSGKLWASSLIRTFRKYHYRLSFVSRLILCRGRVKWWVTTSSYKTWWRMAKMNHQPTVLPHALYLELHNWEWTKIDLRSLLILFWVKPMSLLVTIFGLSLNRLAITLQLRLFNLRVKDSRSKERARSFRALN